MSASIDLQGILSDSRPRSVSINLEGGESHKSNKSCFHLKNDTQHTPSPPLDIPERKVRFSIDVETFNFEKNSPLRINRSSSVDHKISPSRLKSKFCSNTESKSKFKVLKKLLPIIQPKIQPKSTDTMPNTYTKIKPKVFTSESSFARFKKPQAMTNQVTNLFTGAPIPKIAIPYLLKGLFKELKILELNKNNQRGGSSRYIRAFKIIHRDAMTSIESSKQFRNSKLNKIKTPIFCKKYSKSKPLLLLDLDETLLFTKLDTANNGGIAFMTPNGTICYVSPISLILGQNLPSTSLIRIFRKSFKSFQSWDLYLKRGILCPVSHTIYRSYRQTILCEVIQGLLRQRKQGNLCERSKNFFQNF